MHRATADVPADLPQREDFTIPNRRVLLEALAELDRRWKAGAFAEPARKLLKANADHVWQQLTHYDSLVGEIRTAAAAWVKFIVATSHQLGRQVRMGRDDHLSTRNGSRLCPEYRRPPNRPSQQGFRSRVWSVYGA